MGIKAIFCPRCKNKQQYGCMPLVISPQLGATDFISLFSMTFYVLLLFRMDQRCVLSPILLSSVMRTPAQREMLLPCSRQHNILINPFESTCHHFNVPGTSTVRMITALEHLLTWTPSTVNMDINHNSPFGLVFLSKLAVSDKNLCVDVFA